MSDQERLDAISEALAKLIRRQDEFAARLSRLEQHAGIVNPSLANPPVVVPPPVVATPPPLPPPLEVLPPTPFIQEPVFQTISQPPPIPPIEKAALEAQVGLNWMNRIAVITLIFGVAFFFKYAIDNNWIGPEIRVALGVFAGFVTLFFGDLMWKRGQEVFSQGITGLGVAILYLAFWASFSLYHLLPQAMVFSLMVLTTIATVVFAIRHGSQAIAVLALAGGYLTPVVLSTGENHAWILLSYVFLLNCGAGFLTRLRKWLALEYVAAVATVLLFVAVVFDKTNKEPCTIFAVAFYAQAAIVMSPILWGAAQLLAPLAVAIVWTQNANLSLALMWGFAAGGLLVAEARKWLIAPSWTLTCYVLVYLAWREDSTAPVETVFAHLTAVFVLFVLWIIWWSAIAKRPVRSSELFVMAGSSAAYFSASYFLLNPAYHAYMGIFAVTLAAVNLILAKLLWRPDETTPESETWPGILALAITWAFMTLAAPIQFAGFRITMAWALEGAALAWISRRFRNAKMITAAVIVLALAAGHLLVYESSMYMNATTYAAIANLRFFTFAVTAASLFASARFFADRALAVSAYILAHFITLLALGLEIAGWAERSISQAEQFNTITVAISILMASYAVLLVVAGVATHTALNRILGLGLMGLVVVKLYASDIWSLNRVFRIAAFLGLGVLLLTISYLYSRFRSAIEKLWKDQAAPLSS